MGLGPQRFYDDELVRLSIERLWVYAGNVAERHRVDEGLTASVEPWSELYA